MLWEVNYHKKASNRLVMTEKMMNHFHQNVTRKYFLKLAKMKNAKDDNFRNFNFNKDNENDILILVQSLTMSSTGWSINQMPFSVKTALSQLNLNRGLVVTEHWVVEEN